MKIAEILDKLIKNKLKTKASPELDRRIDNLITKAENKHPQESNIWRLIMQSRTTKLITAVAVILVIALGITFLDRSVSPAYAIEQTIEAMRSVSSVHAYCTDWDGSKGETWVQINPETGQEECYYADQGDLLIVATGQVTNYYYKDKNLVRIKKEYMPASEVSFSRIFEELPTWIQEHDGKYESYNEFDEALGKEIIVIHVEIPTFEKEFNIRIDPQTKVPISIEGIRSKPGQGVKSVDKIEYNVSIPEGIFEFEIPDGAKVVYE